MSIEVKDDRRLRFLDLLAQQINRGFTKFNYSSLNVYLVDAIKELPDRDLKENLLNQTEESSEYLWSTETDTETEVLPSSKLLKPEPSLVKASKKNVQISFNVFNQDGIDKTLKSISSLKSSKEQLFYLSQVALCHPSKDIFDSLLKAENAGRTNQRNLETLVKVTELCGRLTVGCSNLKVLHELMQFFLSEAGNVFEELESSNQPDESWVKLKDAIFWFLVHSHLKCQRQTENHEETDPTSSDLTAFRDLFAAILSLYIDVLVMIGTRDESTLNRLSNLVYLLLGDSPSHILDTLNQVSTMDKASIQILLPFFRKVLHSTRAYCTGILNYIKYVSAAWKVLKRVDDLDKDVVAIKKFVCTVVPPDGLLTWISNKNDRMIEEINLSGITERNITKRILECTGDETMEKLLDLVVNTNENREIPQSTLKNDEEKTAEDEPELNSLFFVDSKGSTELLEQVQEEEFTNTKSDNILKKQIDAMLEKLEASDDEKKDEFDVSFVDYEDEEINLITDSTPDHQLITNQSHDTSEDFQKLQVTESEMDISVMQKDHDSPKKDDKTKEKRKRKSKTKSPELVEGTPSKTIKKQTAQKAPRKSAKR